MSVEKNGVFYSLAYRRNTKDAPFPSKEELKIASNETLENARELLEESKLLLQNHHIARSVSLAVFSVEELSKHILCAAYMADIMRTKNTPADFWKHYFHHEKKLKEVELLDNIIIKKPHNPEQARENANLFNEGKMLGLYTNFVIHKKGDAIVDIKSLKPSAVFKKESASSKIDECETRLQLIEKSWERIKNTDLNGIKELEKEYLIRMKEMGMA